MEQNVSGGSTTALQYLAQFGWTFPNGLNKTGNNGDVFAKYGTDRHNYFVIDREGLIVHRSNSGSIYTASSWTAIKPGLIQAITDALEVPVEVTSWGSIKALYR